MKILLTLLITIISIKSYSKIIYCSEESSAGIQGSTSAITTWEKKRYTIEVDFENLKMYSEELLFLKDKKYAHTIKCFKNSNNFMCSNSFGGTFILHMKGYTFAQSNMPYFEDRQGDYVISRGQCEEF